MAQSATTASVGRVNRRFLFLALVLAALSAVLIYPLLTRSSDSGGSAAGAPVVVAQVLLAVLRARRSRTGWAERGNQDVNEFDVAVGDVLQIGDRIVTVIDIENGEISVRIDHVDENDP